MKKILAASAMFFASAMLFAYNPPLAGENIFKLSNPVLSSGGASASGGPFGDVVPGSIAYNPALTAAEQRTAINAAASFLIDTDSDRGFGWGFHAGAIFPNKWMVFTAAAEGVFSSAPCLDVGKQATIHLGLSKEITDSISIGLNGYFGYFFGDGADFIIGADLGFLYSTESLGFLKNPRIGVSILNMGKPLSGDYAVGGINGSSSGTSYPAIFTPRLSFAAEIFSLGSFKNRFTGAFSVDAYFPTFQNAVFDLAFGISYNKIVNLTLGWEANVREIAETKKASWPSVGLGLHLVISSGDTKESREQNEFIPAASWQNLYGSVHNIGVGATMYIGMTDDEAPEVYLWGEQITMDDDN